MNPGFSYREAAVQGAGPISLVVLLYEQAIEDIRRALAAHASGSIEGRTHGISHALLVLGHLEATLDQDRGGVVAANLQRFYRHVRAGLLEAQCKQSAAILEQQIALLMQVREAWCAVERELSLPTAPQNSPQLSAEGERAPADWKA
jgi:flagellar secretion chaperone FliS